MGADIIQNLIVSNSASAGGGGIAWSLSGSRLINNTIAENDSINGSGISVFFAPVLTNALIANNIIIAKQNQIGLEGTQSRAKSMGLNLSPFMVSSKPQAGQRKIPVAASRMAGG